MRKKISLRCRDRISVSAMVEVEVDKTIRDLKLEISKRVGRDFERISLKKGTKELIDAIDIDTYELKDGECIEIEYK